MSLTFVGKDPESGEKACPSLWVDGAGNIVVQGWNPDDHVLAACLATGPVPDSEGSWCFRPGWWTWSGRRVTLPSAEPTFDELFASCRAAAHLELRDTYALTGKADTYAAWRAGKVSGDEYGARWGPFQESVAAAVARGTVFRRLRVVSTPVTEYIRFEHAGTAATIKSGENVRWLDRRHALDLLLPVNDLWLFDARAAVFLAFTGDGDYVGDIVSTDPAVVARALDAFDLAWTRAVPHAEFAV